MNKILIAIRLILTGGCVYGVYLETVPLTAVCIAALGICVELHTVAINAQLESIKLLAGLNTD